MAKSVVELGVKDNGFNAKLKSAMNLFAQLGSAASNAKGQFSKMADGLSQVAQSQQMVNAALKGNPYGLLAEAATTAFTKILEKATEATDAEKRAMEWAEKRAEMEHSVNEAIGRSTGELIAKYELLRTSWAALSTDQEKTDWIKNNQSAFKGLNLAVNDVTSAENVFVKNTSQVVAALKARAEAEAYGELYKEEIKKSALKKATGAYNPQKITADYKPSINEAELAGLTNEDYEHKTSKIWSIQKGRYVDYRERTGRLTSSGVAKMQALKNMGAASLENADRMSAERYGNLMTQAQTNANALSNNNLFRQGSGAGSGKGSKVEVPVKPVYVPEEGTPDYIKAMISDLQAKVGKEKNSEVRTGLLMDIEALKEEYNSMTTIQPLEGLDDPFVEALSPLQQLNADLAKLRKNLELAPNTEAYQQGLQDIIEKEKEIAQFKGVDNKGVDKIKELTEVTNQQQQAFSLAGQAANIFGSALANIEDPAGKVAGLVAQAIGSIALAYGQALAADPTLKTSVYGLIAGSVAAMVSMTTAIAQVHSATGYAEGGIVKGNSYSGDNILANGGTIGLNAGEVVLTKAMQGNLASQLQGGGLQNLKLDGVITGENIHIVHNRYLKRSGQGELVTW